MRSVGSSDRLSPELILKAYALGIFPMARHRHDSFVQWVAPSTRGIIPLESFHVPRRLRRIVRAPEYQVRFDTAFADVIAACASPAPGRHETWINVEIERTYTELHARGHAHSVEVWRDGRLAGGLYGVRIGGAFFGESMVSLAPSASGLALVHLVARLRYGGFTLLDTQFVTDHLRRFGAIEIPIDDYLARLDTALQKPAEFHSELSSEVVESAVADVLTQSRTQMS